MKDYLLKMWRGEFSLARAFWLNWFLAQFVIVPLLFLSVWGFSVIVTDTVFTILFAPLSLVFVICVLAYFLISSVGWFRSTLNYKGFILFKILSFLFMALVIASSFI